MKKFIFIIVAFMLMLIFIGCFATMTPEQRKETYDMRGSVGNSPFVGATPYGCQAMDGASYISLRLGETDEVRLRPSAQG